MTAEQVNSALRAVLVWLSKGQAKHWANHHVTDASPLGEDWVYEKGDGARSGRHRRCIADARAEVAMPSSRQMPTHFRSRP